MTIEKGADWGEPTEVRSGGIEASGDLAREIGLDASPLPGVVRSWLRLPIDVLEVTLVRRDGDAATHGTPTWVVLGSRFTGPFCVVSSTSFVGGRRMFSRAHPNDGRFDWLVFEPGFGGRERFAFWRRLRTELHLPHPRVTTGSGTTFERTWTRPLTARFESGEQVRGVTGLRVVIRPDADWTHLPTR